MTRAEPVIIIIIVGVFEFFSVKLEKAHQKFERNQYCYLQATIRHEIESGNRNVLKQPINI